MKYYLNFSNPIVRLACLMLLTLASSSFAAETVQLKFGAEGQERELRLSIGKSQIIESRTALEQVVIGSPKIADIKLLSSRQVLILGVAPGRTNLVFRDKSQNLVAVMDVVVGYDLNGIKRKLSELLPDEKNIEVRGSNHSVILSGQVNSIVAMDQAVNVAKSYVPKESVINLLEVAGGQQVMLEVHIAEVSRKSLRQLGVGLSYYKDTAEWAWLPPADNINGNLQWTRLAGGNLTDNVTGNAMSNAFSVFSFNKSNASGTRTVGAALDALEQQGLSKTLAEPNLVAMSGQEASFLAGGEFPIPVAQTNSTVNAITVDYKEFGIGLKFTPTVLSNEKINIKLNTEVSSLDSSDAYSIGGGINLPTILTRRAGTTIEMGDGQGFVIAGLMQSDMNNAINKVPGLGSIPILGALFRSTDYQRRETELVVVVTPRLVKPVNPAALQLPTDNVVPPTWLDQYLLGTLEHTRLFHTNARIDRENRSTQMGLEGRYGHQLEEENEGENNEI